MNIYLVFLCISVSVISQETIWHSPMDTSNVNDWNDPNSQLSLSTSTSCPSNQNSCWQLPGASNKNYIYRIASTVGYKDIYLEYNIDASTMEYADGEWCSLQYNIGNIGNNGWSEFIWYDTAQHLNKVYNFGSATFNNPGVGIKIAASDDSEDKCFISNFYLKGTPIATPSTTTNPTSNPTLKPSSKPTSYPTTSDPTTSYPTFNPALKPTLKPTITPTSSPSSKPTLNPTTSDPTTSNPTFNPTLKPTSNPSSKPTLNPTTSGTATNTETPTMNPSVLSTIINPSISTASTSNPTTLSAITAAPTTSNPTQATIFTAYSTNTEATGPETSSISTKSPLSTTRMRTETTTSTEPGSNTNETASASSNVVIDNILNIVVIMLLALMIAMCCYCIYWMKRRDKRTAVTEFMRGADTQYNNGDHIQSVPKPAALRAVQSMSMNDSNHVTYGGGEFYIQPIDHIINVNKEDNNDACNNSMQHIEIKGYSMERNVGNV